jgi:hypothetical protein
MSSRWPGLIGVVLLGATTAVAQGPRGARFAWETVPANARIRIATDSAFIIGRFAGVGRDTLLLASCERRCPPPSSSALRVPIADLRTIFVQEGYRAAEGLKAGVAIGAVAGLATGLLVGHSGELSGGETVLAGTLSGAVLGAAVGPIVGSGLTRWRPLARIDVPAGGADFGVSVPLRAIPRGKHATLEALAPGSGRRSARSTEMSPTPSSTPRGVHPLERSKS